MKGPVWHAHNIVATLICNYLERQMRAQYRKENTP